MPNVRPALVELTSARTKEFVREPEAIFWVFAFPILLAIALGLAFRDKPPDRIPIGVVRGPAAQQRVRLLAKSNTLAPRVVSDEQGRTDLRHGKISLLIDGTGQVIYRYDPTRPESLSAKRDADDTLQAAAGRKNLFSTRDQFVHEQGSRYIDFLIPGLLGMNLMGTGMWGMGFTIANARMKKVVKRLFATPMRKSDYLFAQFL